MAARPISSIGANAASGRKGTARPAPSAVANPINAVQKTVLPQAPRSCGASMNIGSNS